MFEILYKREGNTTRHVFTNGNIKPNNSERVRVDVKSRSYKNGLVSIFTRTCAFVSKGE